MAPHPRQLGSAFASTRGPLLVMAASGCAALGYQIVWTQQFGLLLGHEGAAALAVVAALFGGLSLGAATLGGVIARSVQPARWYAGCEAVMGLWALVLTAGMPAASDLLNTLLGAAPSASRQALVSFGGCFLLMLPATLAMGATLPAMDRLLVQLRSGAGALPALYAANTLGGVVGVLAAALWWLPAWGLQTTALVCALLNAACAAAVLRMPKIDERSLFTLAPQQINAPLTLKGRWLAVLLALTGLLGIAYEVVALRALSQVAENTVYTFALLLAVYLAGTALGAAAWARWGVAWLAGSSGGAPQGRAALLTALCAACGVSSATLWMAPWLKALFTLVLGGGFGAALASEALLAVAAFALPTLVMGALFSHLCAEAQAQGLRLGTALAVNTAGAACAPLVVGAGLAAGLGLKAALCGVVLGYAVLALTAARRPGAAQLALAGALGLALASAPPLLLVDTPEGGSVLSHREGVLGSVSVVQDPAGGRALRINNRQQEGSNTTALADARQALLPLLLHPAPQRALLLGLGAGLTAQAAALDPTLQVLAVELLPEVVQAAQHFNSVLLDTTRAPHLHTHIADARRFVRSTQQQWDVIISDNFHPARAGSGALYTVQHFAAVRERLAPGGTFCQWLPLHQMDLPTLRSIVRSFLAVYPQGAALLATNSLHTPVVGLWAQRDPAPLDAPAAKNRLQRSTMTMPPRDFGFHDEWALLGSFVAGPASLAQFAGAAPLNTDDHPIVSYLAPRATYAPEATPAQRLVQLLALWNADELAVAPVLPATATRLKAYFAARKQHISAGLGVQAVAEPAAMLAQVREPLLTALRQSPDFLPAYEPLLRLALALHPQDPAAATSLLQDLVRLAPAQAGAQEALSALQKQASPSQP